MDVLAHSLWSYALFKDSAGLWFAVLLGVIPDLLVFTVPFIQMLIKRNIPKSAPDPKTIPAWVYRGYDLTHSLVIWAVLFVLVYILTKNWYLPLLAWAVHIIIDIPTHSKQFFPTPFLWPLSDYKFDGLSWAEGWFMAVNYGALALVFFLIILKII